MEKTYNFGRTVNKILQWIAIGLLFLGLFFLFGKCHAEVLNPHAQWQISQFHEEQIFAKQKPKSVEELKVEYNDKISFHRENGWRTYNDAKDKCWWLPDHDHRDNARYCWTGAIALLAPNTPQSKVVACILVWLCQYGIDCLDEWDYINNKMYWSQYHFEMMEFYEDLLKKL